MKQKNLYIPCPVSSQEPHSPELITDSNLRESSLGLVSRKACR